MKGIHIFCASPASTAICTSLDHRTLVRHNQQASLLKDAPRRNKALEPPNSSSSSRGFHHHRTKAKQHSSSPSSSATAREIREKTPPLQPPRKSREVLRSPPGSSRYLLNDSSSILDLIPDFEPVRALVPFQGQQQQRPSTQIKKYEAPRSSSDSQPDQVVVLRVSLHCKGCEGKVRKHISRMEGVSSFSIDFANKKVTVIGDLSPQCVLQSVARVKNAQFWSSPSS
ncbi:hypothetical protein AMTR_s00034p00190630 [Amborella trichopoda]|uniref:HMA domain-containing protein n=2 Tax=Amborella trichopoda TaxID=13333 RepID=W1PWQ5_AMBTC|nr:hypothetical protein AMTR_s00034p00190630 [Amborella trichopoda]